MTKRQATPTAADTSTDEARADGEAPQAKTAKPSARTRKPRDPEAATVAYLRAHPDFFDRHPDVLAHLRIHHDTGGAVSLIEHQVVVLRRQLDTERGRLAHLISRARDYETLSARLHDLVLHLIPAEGLDHLCRVLHDVLLREFSAEAVVLKLFPLEPAPLAGAAQDPLVAAFRDFLDRPHALCGPLDPDQGAALFGETGAGLHSAVLVPIRAGARSGVLAIGAADRERFGPDMRTDLLDRLGEIVSVKLLAIPDDPAPVEPPAPKRSSRAKTRGAEAGSAAPTPKPRAKGARTGSGKTGPKPVAPAGSGRRAKRDPEPEAGPESPAEGQAADPGLHTATE